MSDEGKVISINLREDEAHALLDCVAFDLELNANALEGAEREALEEIRDTLLRLLSVHMT